MGSALTKKLVIFGLAGRGKSTFLNHLLLGPEAAQDNTRQLFHTSVGSDSCTSKVTAVTHNIFGTMNQVTVYDTPGVFAGDMNITTWFKTIQTGLPGSFDALIWVVNIKERTLALDIAVYDALEIFFKNFTFSNVILVFTHCDTLMTKDPTPQEAAKSWISNLSKSLTNKSLQTKIQTDSIVYFGCEEGKRYTPNYVPEFIKALSSLPSATLAVNSVLPVQAISTKVLGSIDPKMQFSGGIFEIVNKRSSLVLDIEGGSRDNCINICQWGRHGGAHQKFQIILNSQGHYTIRAVHSGKVLDVTGSSKENGAKVIQYQHHGGNNQNWWIKPDGKGYFQIIAVHSNKALDVPGGSCNYGTRLIQWESHGGDNQLFSFKLA